MAKNVAASAWRGRAVSAASSWVSGGWTIGVAARTLPALLLVACLGMSNVLLSCLVVGEDLKADGSLAAEHAAPIGLRATLLAPSVPGAVSLTLQLLRSRSMSPSRLHGYGIGMHLIKGCPPPRPSAINPKACHISFQVWGPTRRPALQRCTTSPTACVHSGD